MRRPLLTVLAVLFLLSFRAGAQSSRWYLIEMFGAKAGYMHATEDSKDGRIINATHVVIDMKRGVAPISVAMSSEFIETKDGKPISMKSVQKMGATAVTQECTFNPDGSIESVGSQGDQVNKTSLPKPEGEWMTPAAAERHSVAQFKAGAKEIIVRAIDPMSGVTPITATRKIGASQKITSMGREIDAIKTTVTVSNQPGITSTEYLNSEGELIRSETQLGGIGVTMTAATEEEAKKEGDGPAPEVFASTFIKPDRKIANARTLTRGVYIISTTDGNELAEMPDTGTQKYERLAPDKARLTITVEAIYPAAPEDVANRAFLASTAMCSITDEKVKELALRALTKLEEGETGELDKAKACRDFVYGFIKKKSLGVGFASATETARSREGDCSEHGVLLCALLRANGIRARVATGLIYADSFAGSQNIFGYHMWAQALITADGKSRWVDLDATLPMGITYDATHICMGTSDLADGDQTQSMMSVATSMGRVKIQVGE